MDASKEKLYHLKRQILPGIAAYETLQTVMSKKEALQTVHGYVERRAGASHKQLVALLRVPVAGDWLLGCVPFQKTDTDLFNRAYYLSGSYAFMEARSGHRAGYNWGLPLYR